MSTTSQEVKAKRSLKHAKFSTRIVRRCWRCGRRRGYIRDFDLCRICFRELASNNELPGVRKASW
ncbi:MAG: type Z 30S ribosomal protein S14 [Patescibacteria group bacterium]